MNADRLLAFAAALGCKALEVRDCLRSLAGNGRPASLDEHFATVPRDPNPGWQEAAAAFADADAAWDEPYRAGTATRPEDIAYQQLVSEVVLDAANEWLHTNGDELPETWLRLEVES